MTLDTVLKRDLVAAVKAAYRTDLAQDAWLLGIGEAVERMVGHGEGTTLLSL